MNTLEIIRAHNEEKGYGFSVASLFKIKDYVSRWGGTDEELIRGTVDQFYEAQRYFAFEDTARALEIEGRIR